MNESPKLSIIIPCYNNGKYLVKMLDCFISQTSKNWEVIIVDDGSTDETPILIKEYTLKDQRIKYYSRNRQPKGSVVCRNIGYNYSTGKYICHLDADDLVSQTFVEHRVQFMEDNPDIDYASFCAKTFKDGDSSLQTYDTKVTTYGVKANNGDILEDFLSANYSFSVWNNIYRKESIKDLPWDENVKIYTDFSFIVPGILKGLKHKFADIREVDYFYRTYSGKNTASINMCSNFVSEEKNKSTLYLFKKTLDSLKSRKDYQLRKKQFERFVILNFERLIKGNDQDQITNYILFTKEYMDEELAKKFEKINSKTKNIKNFRKFECFLYWKLLTTLKQSYYRSFFIHSFVKLIIGK